MLLLRAAMLALLVACACVGVTRALEETVVAQDIDGNQVLPEKDVVKGRVNEVPAWAPAPQLVEDKPAPKTDAVAAVAETTPSSSEPAPSTSPADTPPSPTTTDEPPRSTSALGRFLSDIMQIPINMFRTVSGLLSSTFSGSSDV